MSESTEKYAVALAQRAPLSLQNCKKLVNQSDNMTMAEMLAAEAAIQGKLVVSSDCKEGLAAFKEKRQPQFKGE